MDIATINQKIIAFAEAWKNAEQNAQIMCGQPTTEMVDACAERMSVLDETEDDFGDLRGLDNLPSPLRDFFEADNDKGCIGCWLSSIRKNNHPECQAKISRWFKTREALVKYGEELKQE